MASVNRPSNLSSRPSTKNGAVSQVNHAELEGSQHTPLQELTLDEQKDQNDGPPPRTVKGPVWALIVVSLVCANLLISMDNTIVATIQPPLILDLGDYSNFPWIAVGYALGAVSVNLFW